MPRSVLVSELMSNPKEWPQFRAGTSIAATVKLLRIISDEEKLEHGHTTPLVLDDDYKLLGFIHLVDLVKQIRVLCDKSEGHCEIPNAAGEVRSITTPFSFTVVAGDDIVSTLDKMIEHKVTLAPVLEDGKLIGMIKLGDIFGKIVDLLVDAITPDERQQLMKMHSLR